MLKISGCLILLLVERLPISQFSPSFKHFEVAYGTIEIDIFSNPDMSKYLLRIWQLFSTTQVWTRDLLLLKMGTNILSNQLLAWYVQLLYYTKKNSYKPI